VLGVALLIEGASYIGGPDPGLGIYLLSLLVLAAGTLLLAGFLTPFVGMAIAAGAVAALFSLLPVCSPSVFESKAAMVFAMTMLLTVIGSGPGRFSVDARMFGRREILISPPEDNDRGGHAAASRVPRERQ